MSKLLSILDLDSMLHIVANVQYSAGNRDRPGVVKAHVHRFISTICKNSGSNEIIMLFQAAGHQNFRNAILPSYKGHRVPKEAVILWKPTIIEAFKEAGAIGLNYIETDDAMSALAEHLGYNKVLLITGDKDMRQVPSNFYNPFKTGIKFEERWGHVDKYQAERFLWEQVLSGDSTDMPSEFCGIEGVGAKTASKMTDNDLTYGEIIQKEYQKKYGAAGFHRAQITYQMVRLLKLKDRTHTYITKEAQQELIDFIDNHKFTKIKDEVEELLKPKKAYDPTSLFKK